MGAWGNEGLGVWVHGAMKGWGCGCMGIEGVGVWVHG